MENAQLTTIDLFYHGLTQGNRYFQGDIDDPLSEIGWQQMWAAVGDYCQWEYIVSSPLRRCAEFAQDLSQKSGVPLAIIADLQAFHFGQWQGKTPAQITQHQPNAILDFQLNPFSAAPPASEPIDKFSQRVLHVWQFLLDEHEGKHLLVITHAMVIRVILCHILEIPLQNLFRIQINDTSMSRVCSENKDDKVLQSLIHHGGPL